MIPSTNVAGVVSAYEIWAADQSNTVPNQTALGLRGGHLWIWNDEAIKQTITDPKKAAAPLPCKPKPKNGPWIGPCDIFDIFKGDLVQMNLNGATGYTLQQLDNVGTWHGIVKDRSNKYVLARLFARGGGYVGIIDTRTKGAVALFRVTKYSHTGDTGAPTGDRLVHMTFWSAGNQTTCWSYFLQILCHRYCSQMESLPNHLPPTLIWPHSADGLQCIVANLHGKAIERIKIVRNNKGDIASATFETNASLGLGKNMSVVEPATYFSGTNAYGKALIGGVAGNYSGAALGDLTPIEKCKENGCSSGPNGGEGGRTNNRPVCPIPASQGNLLYITLSGGGLLISNSSTTPMTIVAEYGKNIIFGSGCGGVEVGGTFFINSGVASGVEGATQSYFAIWAFNNTNYLGTPPNENEPKPLTIYNDTGNIGTTGNPTGQLPSNSSRRDSHGIVVTRNGKYVHVFDRVQSQAFVIETGTNAGNFSYSLRDSNVCKSFSVTDDVNLPTNDASPDLVETTPDGKYLAVGLRGPAPVTFSHTTQGSCPGVGIVQLLGNGRRGKLVTVLRTTNITPDNITRPLAITGGVNYTGNERSDVHMVAVIDCNLF